ncbi:MAG: CU044_2847 family protein [Caldilineaceae bacterium]
MERRSRTKLTSSDLNIDMEDATGFTVLVEFPDLQETLLSGEEGARGALSDLEERSQRSIEAAMRTIRAMAIETNRMRKKIPSGAQPDVARIKFGVNLDLKAGALLASTGIGAALEVELEWTRRPDSNVADAVDDTDVHLKTRPEDDSEQVDPLQANAGVNAGDGETIAQEQTPQAAVPRSEGRANFYALLIGVDHYSDADGRDLFKPLSGCVRDVDQMEAYLNTHLERPPDYIVKLTATDGGREEPEEPPTSRPTYANIVGAFRTLTSIAQPGDQVYIHYSGHGGRAVTAYPDIKGSVTGYDESLVPSDYNLAGGNYLRDVQLAYLLQQMVNKDVEVTVVLDSCHSAGATRGDEALNASVRGALEPDNALRAADDLVASPSELLRFWREMQTASPEEADASATPVTRNAKPASGWLIEPRGYVLLAACRANELAYEFAFDGANKGGALTHWLLDTLRNAGPDFTYRMVHNRVAAKVHTQFVRQSPQLQGEVDRTLFSGNRINPAYAVNILAVEDDRIQLQAGAVHGLKAGDSFAVSAAGSSGQQAVDIATVEVTNVEAVTSWASIVDLVAGQTIRVGDRAIPVRDFRLQRGVAVIADDPQLRRRVEQAIDDRGQGFLHTKEPAAEGVLDFQVVFAHGEVEIWDAAGVPIPNLRPALTDDDPNLIDRLVERLVHLAKYRDVQQIDAADSGMRSDVSVNVEMPEDHLAPDGVRIAHPGDIITLHITNHDQAQPISVAVLDLQPDWGISQLFPANAAHEIIEPGATIPVRFKAYLPDGYTQGTDIYKVMATRADTDYLWLQLPALGQPNNSQRDAVAANSPLERMFQRLTIDHATQRNGRLVDDAEWTVVQVEVPIVDPDGISGEE